MKKYIAFPCMAFSLLLAACGGSSTSSQPAADSAKSTVGSAASNNPDYQKGLALVAKNDCLTCHQITRQGTGPAYQDVANKYTDDEATINTLAQKVIKGGSGNWGTVPMVPHADLSMDDAKAMVKYILLLKNQ